MMKIHTLVLGALGTNCYIWEDEETKSAIVIDAPDDADKIIEYAKNHGIKICDIILTHGHFDHILALSELKQKTGARLCVFSKTVPFLENSNLNLGFSMGMECQAADADKILHDGDVIDFNGNQITIIHTPGHTEDSICLYFKDTLISGDTLFRLSVGRWDFPTGDAAEEVKSIKEKLMVLPDETRVYPGHGAATTIGEERRGNPYIR